MRLLLFCSSLLLSCSAITAQSDAFTNYDLSTGRANAAVYNGPVYINPFRPDQVSHHYYSEDSFRHAVILYEGQPYKVDQLKYDIHQNKLVLQSVGDYSNIAIDLILDKVSEFTLNNNHFVKLNSVDTNRFPANQYYEQITINPTSTIYVLHHKIRKEVFKGDAILDHFSKQNEYYLSTHGEIVLINSKRDAIKAFPNLKRNINDFASANRNLLKTDRSTFMENLLRFVSTQKNN